MTTTDTQPREAEQRLYDDFTAEHLAPLWTAREELMPFHPVPAARPHLWRWSVLHPLAQRAAGLVPVGRGGERRAIALANPGLGGLPYATPTLCRYPVPRSEGGSARAPAYPECLPVRA